MIRQTAIIFVMFMVANSQRVNRCDPYCWTDYLNVVPDGAVEVGRDSSGQPIYVGEVFLSTLGGVWTPCMIFPDDDVIVISSLDTALKISPALHVHILSSSHDQGDFRWVKTSVRNLRNLRNYHVVRPEHQSYVYIGRRYHDSQLYVGAVYLPSSAGFQGFFINSDDGYYQYSSFEVLTFQHHTRYPVYIP